MYCKYSKGSKDESTIMDRGLDLLGHLMQGVHNMGLLQVLKRVENEWDIEVEK